MRQRIDAGSGLVAVGSAVLLVSLFLDWYQPGLSAWTSFEVLDLALAGLAVAALAGAAGIPGPGTAMVRWGPLLSLAAFVLVASQLIDPPPGVEAGRQAGAWLALAAALTMGAGSALAVSRISVTVDLQGRDPRRAVAVDRREGGEEDEADAVTRGGAAGNEGADPGATQAFEATERPGGEDATTTADEGSGDPPRPRDRPPTG